MGVEPIVRILIFDPKTHTIESFSFWQAMESAEPVLAVRSYGRMKRAGFQADERPASLEFGAFGASGTQGCTCWKGFRLEG